MKKTTLKGKTCLITGASGGLGRALSVQFAEAGCDLFLTGRREDRLVGLAENMRGEFDATVETATCDLRDPAALDALGQEVESSFGHIDILVNCAGIFPVKSISDSDLTEFDSTLAVNLRAPFVLAKRYSAQMTKHGWGRIINVGSSSSLQGFRDTAIYCASKHALLGLSRALHAELSPHNVRVFCFMPGSIKTEMGRQIVNQSYETFMEPDEIAAYIVNAIAFDGELVSPEVSFTRMRIT